MNARLPNAILRRTLVLQ